MEIGSRPQPHLVTPTDNAAPVPGILEMLPADCVRLGAEADVPVPRERVSGMLQGLAERRAAVAAAVLQARAYVQVSVEIDDADRDAGPDVTEVVAECRLVPAAEHHRDGTRLQDRGDDRAEGVLRFLQAARAA